MNKVYRVWRGPTFAASLPCQLDNCARCLFSTLYCDFHLIALHQKLLLPLLELVLNCLFKQYVAVQTASQDDEVVLYLVNELDSKINPATSSSETLSKSHVINPGKDKLRILGEQETLAGLKTGNFVHGYLVSSSKIYVYILCANSSHLHSI